MIDPGFGQAMPFSAFDRANAVGNGRDRQQATIGALMQTGEPAFESQALQFKVDRRGTAQRGRPQCQQLLITLQ
ncbi:hypothetical protein D3C77_702810 [compost metagenome]